MKRKMTAKQMKYFGPKADRKGAKKTTSKKRGKKK